MRRCAVLYSPVAVLENLNALAVLGYADNGKVLAAYHEVNVNHGIVYAYFLALFIGIVFIVFKAVVETSAES